MQVTVEKTSELNRKMIVSIPDTVVQEKMETRFKSLAREVKIDGFRPGKAPAKVIRQLYGERVRNEITGDLIQSTYFEALQQQNLTPAGQPHILPSDAAEHFEYIAEFEVYPEVSLDGVSELQISRPVAEVTEDDVDSMIEKLRLQKKTWNEAHRASQDGDQVTLHFSGESESENFTGGKAENQKIEIGSGQMMPGFEEEVTGLTAGEHKTFPISFPENYHNTNLAGKMATFEVEVVSVEEPVLPEADAEFIKSYGVDSGDYVEFRADVKANMERELQQGLKNRLKHAVLNALYDTIQIPTPNALIDQEVDAMMRPFAERAVSMGQKLENLQLPKDVFETQARRRVALSLIMGEIIQKNDIKIDATKVFSVIEDMAKSYEKPEDVINWYYSDDNRLNDVRQMVLEDQTIEWIVSQAKVADETLGFNEVMDKQQQEA
ncbi:MAG: trigger factor [Methylococcales bacterium]|nr:trigger factor [Methylococcales bacterium]